MVDENSDIVWQNLSKRLAQLEKDKLIAEGQIAEIWQLLRPRTYQFVSTSLEFLASPLMLRVSQACEFK